jgi:hypothetical protein
MYHDKFQHFYTNKTEYFQLYKKEGDLSNTIDPFTYFEYQISGGIFFPNLQVKLLTTYFI